ncbi:unnamed protein product [Penicillium pancosmium]
MASESAHPFPPGFNISTSRLRIIPFHPANQTHAEFLVQLWNTEDFINFCGRTSISTPEKASNFIQQRVLQQYSVNKYGMFLVSLKEGENTTLSPIGTVSLMKGASPDPHFLAPDIGFAVLPEHSGKGYAAEAAKGLLEWARTDRGVEAAFGFCDPSNRRSREDISGTVIETGHSVTRFKANDLVLASAQGAIRGAHIGGFQEYVVAEASFACLIPKYMKFSEGAVFPLCFTTASHALFNSKFLALPKPSLDIRPESSGKSVLIWGDASAVGMNAIQLARAAGLEVYATASPRNFEYLKKLGANRVFDYTSETAVAEIVAALGKSACTGIFQAAGAEASVKPCLDIADRADGNIFVVTTTPLVEGSVPEGVRAEMVFGNKHDDILEIWEKFLPQALFQKKYLIAPEPAVIEQKGLEGIQEGFNILRKGVSAKKIVVAAD